MRSGRRVLAEVLTGEDGWFSLPLPEKRRATVEVISDAWRFTPAEFKLDQDQVSGVEELQFQAERIVAAPLRGTILDQKTGEPVPDFLVQVRGPRGGVEDIVTGSDGSFESAGGFEAGRLDLALVDHPSFLEKRTTYPIEANSIEHQHDFRDPIAPRDAELRIAIGPTYRLEIAFPSGTGADDFHAAFPQPSSGQRGFHRASAEDPQSAMALFYGRAIQPWALEQEAPLRGADPIWARFREPVFDMSAGSDAGVHELHVRSRDGHWSGRATVSSLGGIYPTLVPIRLEAHGAIEGTVLDAKGRPVPSAWIRLSDSAVPSQPVREAGADAKGSFAFKWLAEGEYEVLVESDRYDEWGSKVSIEAGSTERLEVRLSTSVPLGPVSGVLRSRTGQHRSKGGMATLRSLDDPEFHLFKVATYRKRDGEYRAAFSFEEVPSGSYELSLEPLDNMRWERLSMTVSPPAEGLEFICEDDVSTFDLEFRVVDAQTGARIASSWSIVWQGDPLEDVRLDADWEAGLYKAVPDGASLRWVLRAKGYRLAVGDETRMRIEGDRRVIDVKLEPGWGQMFKVTTTELVPLQGVALFADGNSIGVTDSRGMVSMDLDAKPGALEFRYEDWIVGWGRVDPNEFGYGWGSETAVQLRPPE